MDSATAGRVRGMDDYELAMKICPKCGGILYLSSYFQAWVCKTPDCDYWRPKKKTPWDRIKDMTEEEFSEWVVGVMCHDEQPYGEIRAKVLHSGEFLKWLKGDEEE